MQYARAEKKTWSGKTQTGKQIARHEAAYKAAFVGESEIGDHEICFSIPKFLTLQRLFANTFHQLQPLWPKFRDDGSRILKPVESMRLGKAGLLLWDIYFIACRYYQWKWEWESEYTYRAVSNILCPRILGLARFSRATEKWTHCISCANGNSLHNRLCNLWCNKVTSDHFIHPLVQQCSADGKHFACRTSTPLLHNSWWPFLCGSSVSDHHTHWWRMYVHPTPFYPFSGVLCGVTSGVTSGFSAGCVCTIAHLLESFWTMRTPCLQVLYFGRTLNRTIYLYEEPSQINYWLVGCK